MRSRLFRGLCLLLALCILTCAPVSAAELNWAQRLVGLQTALDHGLTGEGIVIGLIDSGISAAYAETLPVLTGTNYLVSESSADRHNTDDTVGHGTNVASILADPAIGLVPDATLVPLKCFSSNSGSYTAVIEALYDAVDVYHCDVVNMSLGGTLNDPELAAAVQYALDSGVILIAAAGNISSGSTGHDRYYYPASYEGVISVGSVSSAKVISNTSIQNDRVWITAPGKTVPVYAKNGGYSTNSGTSIAAPFVAAAAALALCADPELTPEDFADLLRQTAEDLGAEGHDNAYGYGFLDLDAMLSALQLDLVSWTYSPDNTQFQAKLCFPGRIYQAMVVHYSEEGQLLSLKLYPNLMDTEWITCEFPPENHGTLSLLVSSLDYTPIYNAQTVNIPSP